MPDQSCTDLKREALRNQGDLNPHPELVLDPLFGGNEFFDPRDLIQVKYEMVRRVAVDGVSVAHAAVTFGFSRPAFYQAQLALAQSGLPGLVPQKRGPRQAHKLSPEVMALVDQALADDASLRAPALAHRLKEQRNLVVHPRSIERALARRGKRRR